MMRICYPPGGEGREMKRVCDPNVVVKDLIFVLLLYNTSSKDGRLKTQYMQGNCRLCGIKTTYVCAECSDTNPSKNPYTCVAKNGKM